MISFLFLWNQALATGSALVLPKSSRKFLKNLNLKRGFKLLKVLLTLFLLTMGFSQRSQEVPFDKVRCHTQCLITEGRDTAVTDPL